MNEKHKNVANFDEEDLARKRFDGYPTGKFLKLMQSEWKTPDYTSFFIWRDDPIDEYGGFVVGCVDIDCIRNTYLPDALNREYLIHISSIGITNDFRGCGFLAYVCSRIIDWADEAGVFVYGHARGFEYPIPLMHDAEEASSWLENRHQVSPHILGMKKDFAQSRKLHQKYVEYGFKRFDGAGVRFENRKWKKLCFGHFGESCDNERVRDFAQRHLKS